LLNYYTVQSYSGWGSNIHFDELMPLFLRLTSSKHFIQLLAGH